MISFTSLLAGFQTCYCSLWFMIKTPNFKIKFNNVFQTKQSNISKKKQYTDILRLLYQLYIYVCRTSYIHIVYRLLFAIYVLIQRNGQSVSPDIKRLWVFDSRLGLRNIFLSLRTASVANNLPLNYPIMLEVISYISRRDSKQLFLVKHNSEKSITMQFKLPYKHCKMRSQPRLNTLLLYM